MGGTKASRAIDEDAAELAPRQMLRRTILREKLPVTWSAISRFYRRLELRRVCDGHFDGTSRFLAGFAATRRTEDQPYPSKR